MKMSKQTWLMIIVQFAKKLGTTIGWGKIDFPTQVFLELMFSYGKLCQSNIFNLVTVSIPDQVRSW